MVLLVITAFLYRGARYLLVISEGFIVSFAKMYLIMTITVFYIIVIVEKNYLIFIILKK